MLEMCYVSRLGHLLIFDCRSDQLCGEEGEWRVDGWNKRENTRGNVPTFGEDIQKSEMRLVQ